MWNVFAHSPPSPWCDKDDSAPFSPLPPPPHPYPILDNNSEAQWWISVTASVWRSWVEKLISDSDANDFCFYQFLIGRLWAEILTAEVWRKSVKSWWAPIFSGCQYLWHFLHGGPVQISQNSAGESPPIKAGQHHTWWLNVEGTTSSRRRASARSGRSQLLWTLPGQTSKEMLLHMRQQFGGANILWMPRFCQRLDFRC